LKEALVATGEKVVAMSTIKMHLADEKGLPGRSGLYGKVLRTGAGGEFLLHFTSVEPELGELLAAKCAMEAT